MLKGANLKGGGQRPLLTSRHCSNSVRVHINHGVWEGGEGTEKGQSSANTHN